MSNSTETDFLTKAVQVLVPQPCYDEYFHKYNFMHGDCMKIVLSKILGFGIILGSMLVKLPQVIKIARAKSAEGINFFSVLCELIAVSATSSYGFARQFPFSSYGEGIFLVLQTTSIAFLVLLYGRSLMSAMTFLGIYVAVMAYLFSPAVPITFLAFLQSVNIGIIILSKVLQATTNYKNGSTGQLSVITVTLLFLGSILRIFTSVQETGDPLTVFTYIVSTFANGLILSQIIFYWNSKPKPKRE